MVVVVVVVGGISRLGLRTVVKTDRFLLACCSCVGFVTIVSSQFLLFATGSYNSSFVMSFTMINQPSNLLPLDFVSAPVLLLIPGIQVSCGTRGNFKQELCCC